MHAASLAEVVGIRTVLVPPLAGVLSAVGLLRSVMEVSLVEPVARLLGLGLPEELERRLEPMASRLRARVPGATIRTTLEMAFRGQGSDLAIEVASPLPPAEALAETFRARHRTAYGHDPAAAIEVVRVRMVASAPPPDQRLTRPAGDRLQRELSRAAHFGGAPVRVCDRSELDRPRRGPLYVDDPETTTVVPAGWAAVLDGDRNLVLTR